MPANTVAQVGGKPVTKAQLERWMAIDAGGSSTRYRGRSVKLVAANAPHYRACVHNIDATLGPGHAGSRGEVLAECKRQHAELLETALTHLIFFDWLIGEAGELGIRNWKAAAHTRLAAMRREEYPTEAAFKKYLRTSHYTEGELLLRIAADDVLYPKIEAHAKAAAKAPSKAEIARYYQAHRAAYHLPERRTIRVVVTHSASRAAAAKRAIEAGTSFTSVARRYSVATVSREKGGVIAEMQRLPHAVKLSNAIFAAQPRTLVGPVDYASSYYVFEVVKVFKARQLTLQAATDAVRHAILAPREEAAAERFGTAFRAKWKRRTHCRAGYVVPYCSESTQKVATTSTSTQRATGAVTATSTATGR